MAGEKQISGNLRLRLNGENIFDAIGCTLSMAREVTSTPGTKDTGAGSNRKGTKSWTVSFNGLGVYAGDGNGGHDFKALVDLWNDDSETLPDVEFVPEESDYQFYYEGLCIITSLEGVFNYSETATVTLSATGSGPLSAVDKATTAPGA